MSRISLVNETKSFSATSFTKDGPITLGQNIELTHTFEINKDFILSPSDVILVDTRQSSVNLYLPKLPADGTAIRLIDAYNTFKKNPVILVNNGNRIEGYLEDYSLSKGLIVDVVFSIGVGWEIKVFYSTSSGDGNDVTIINIDEIYKSQLERAQRMVIRYDYDSNGSYIIDGYNVTYVEDEGDYHVLRVSEGVAHVQGIECILNASQKFKIDRAFDFKTVDNEPHSFTGNGYYTLRWNPIKSISEITGVKQMTNMDVVHGTFTGASDLLSPNPVINIQSVTQGATTYIKGVDFTQDRDYINWSPTGGSTKEPSPGSTYQVTYTYQDTVSATISADKKQIYLSGLAPDSIFYVTYDFYIPRIDRIALTKTNTINVIKGRPDFLNPIAPQVGEDLPLALVEVAFGQVPKITWDYYKIMRASDTQILSARVTNNEYNIAKLNLATDLLSRDPTLYIKNTYTDPFYDDDLRDKGKPNTASVIGQTLLLPINWENTTINSGNRIYLDYTEENFISQLAETTTHKVEPYLWANTPPAYIEIDPKVYSWTAKTTYEGLFRDIWVHGSDKAMLIRQAQEIGGTADDIVWGRNGEWWNRRFFIGWDEKNWYSATSAAAFDNYIKSLYGTASTTSATSAVIPNITINVRGSGYNRGETVKIDFDQITVVSTLADQQGKYTAQFQVPPNQMSGTKLVTAIGLTSGAVADTTFVAAPVAKLVREITYRRVDPIAQTFIPLDNGMITAFECVFTSRPKTWAIAKLCRTTVGMPDDAKIVSTCIVQPENIIVDGWTKFAFEPYRVYKDEEYAVMLECLDRDVTVRSAKMGQWDRVSGKWMNLNPYTSGLLLDSSTATTWTPFQDEDLTFRIKKAKFNTDKEVVLTDTLEVTDATDLMILARTEIPESCLAYFEVRLLDRQTDNVFLCTQYNPVSFAQYTGKVKVTLFLNTIDTAFSPAVDGDIEISIGKLSKDAVYTGRAFETTGSKLQSYVALYEPGSASISMRYLDPQLKLSLGSGSNLWTTAAPTVPNTYYYTGNALQGRVPTSVVVDGIEYTQVESVLSIAPEQWAWGKENGQANNTLYIYSTVDPDAQASDYVKAAHFLDMTRSSDVTPIGDNFYEVPFSITDANLLNSYTQVQLLLSTPDTQSRPAARDLRTLVSV